jgi:hypothetical protein
MSRPCNASWQQNCGERNWSRNVDWQIPSWSNLGLYEMYILQGHRSVEDFRVSRSWEGEHRICTRTMTSTWMMSSRSFGDQLQFWSMPFTFWCKYACHCASIAELVACRNWMVVTFGGRARVESASIICYWCEHRHTCNDIRSCQPDSFILLKIHVS